MLNFVFQNPAKIFFGKNQLINLAPEIKKYSSKVLLVYGGGSIKKTGLYEEVAAAMQAGNISFTELAGVQPNPRIDSVREGVRRCREEDIGLILAVGGGSVIDCAKAIAAGYFYEGDPWDFFTYKARVTKALPVGVVLTLAATGTEMNVNTVISNDQTQEKIGIGSKHLIPRFAILDPVYTFSVPAEQTAAGTADIMSHVFEQYFSANDGAYLLDRLAEAVLKTCIHFAPIAIKEPENYEARANLMWAGTIALNGLLSTGKETDWATHEIEHQLSARYDMTHGLGLAILTPHWMEYVLSDKTAGKMAEYARNVWLVQDSDNFEAARNGIRLTREFFHKIGLKGSLQELGVTAESLPVMAENAAANPIGRFKQLVADDVLKILQSAY